MVSAVCKVSMEHLRAGYSDFGYAVFNSEPCQLRVARGRFPCAIVRAGVHTDPTPDFNAGIGAAEMLGKANYIALVGGGKLPKFPQNKVSQGKPNTPARKLTNRRLLSGTMQNRKSPCNYLS